MTQPCAQARQWHVRHCPEQKEALSLTGLLFVTFLRLITRKPCSSYARIEGRWNMRYSGSMNLYRHCILKVSCQPSSPSQVHVGLIWSQLVMCIVTY